MPGSPGEIDFVEKATIYLIQKNGQRLVPAGAAGEARRGGGSRGYRQREHMESKRQTTILTIDDEAVIRQSFHAYLEDYDYRVL